MTCKIEGAKKLLTEPLRNSSVRQREARNPTVGAQFGFARTETREQAVKCRSAQLRRGTPIISAGSSDPVDRHALRVTALYGVLCGDLPSPDRLPDDAGRGRRRQAHRAVAAQARKSGHSHAVSSRAARDASAAAANEGVGTCVRRGSAAVSSQATHSPPPGVGSEHDGALQRLSFEERRGGSGERRVVEDVPGEDDVPCRHRFAARSRRAAGEEVGCGRLERGSSRRPCARREALSDQRLALSRPRQTCDHTSVTPASVRRISPDPCRNAPLLRAPPGGAPFARAFSRTASTASVSISAARTDRAPARRAARAQSPDPARESPGIRGPEESRGQRRRAEEGSEVCFAHSPEAKSSTRLERTASGLSRTYRASARPPGQATAQNGTGGASSCGCDGGGADLSRCSGSAEQLTERCGARMMDCRGPHCVGAVRGGLRWEKREGRAQRLRLSHAGVRSRDWKRSTLLSTRRRDADAGGRYRAASRLPELVDVRPGHLEQPQLRNGDDGSRRRRLGEASEEGLRAETARGGLAREAARASSSAGPRRAEAFGTGRRRARPSTE